MTLVNYSRCCETICGNPAAVVLGVLAVAFENVTILSKLVLQMAFGEGGNSLLLQ